MGKSSEPCASGFFLVGYRPTYGFTTRISLSPVLRMSACTHVSAISPLSIAVNGVSWRYIFSLSKMSCLISSGEYPSMSKSIARPNLCWLRSDPVEVPGGRNPRREILPPALHVFIRMTAPNRSLKNWDRSRIRGSRNQIDLSPKRFHISGGTNSGPEKFLGQVILCGALIRGLPICSYLLRQCSHLGNDVPSTVGAGTIYGHDEPV